MRFFAANNQIIVAGLRRLYYTVYMETKQTHKNTIAFNEFYLAKFKDSIHPASYAIRDYYQYKIDEAKNKLNAM